MERDLNLLPTEDPIMLSITACYPSRFIDHGIGCDAPQSIVYNGHAGLGANLVDDPVDVRPGNEIVTDNKDPDKAVSLSLPEVDDEVLVAFEHSDSRRPCLIASLWNSGGKPPETKR